MALVSLYVNDIIGMDWSYANKRYEWNYNKLSNYSEENTYVIIFGPNQTEHLEKFRKHYSKDIIFEGKKACNRNYRTGPRNTLIIFEKQKESAKADDNVQVPSL